jgi:hypothetical protein
MPEILAHRDGGAAGVLVDPDPAPDPDVDLRFGWSAKKRRRGARHWLDRGIKRSLVYRDRWGEATRKDLIVFVPGSDQAVIC